MIELRGHVELSDGTTQQFVGGPWAMSQWERYAGRSGMDSDPQKAPMTYSLYLAYAAIHRDQWGKCEGFEAWSAKVDDVELEASDARPTPSTASEG